MSKISRGYRPIKTIRSKLVNRRIVAGLMIDGTVWYKFRILDEHKRIGQQEIRLSPEAVVTMCKMMFDLAGINLEDTHEND